MRAYKDTVPPTPWFIGAAKGQLELFARLGVRAELAKAIMADLAPRRIRTPAPPSIVIVVGHWIDEPGRAARFPESAVPAVRERLREKLAAQSGTGRRSRLGFRRAGDRHHLP